MCKCKLVLFAVLIVSVVYAQDIRTDRFGDALPPGAVQRLGTLRMRTGAADLAYLPDGNAVVASGQQVAVWDLSVGETIVTYKISGSSLVSIAVRSDGNTLLAGDSSGKVIEWCMEQGSELRGFDSGVKGLRTVCYSPDETRVLVAGRVPPVIKEFELETGRELMKIDVEKMPRLNLAFYGSDGTTAFAGGGRDDDIVAEYDLKTGEKTRNLLDRLEGLPNWYYMPYHMILSPDGKRLLVGGRYKGCEIDLVTGDVLQTYGGLAGGAVNCVAYLPDGERILMGSRDGSIWLRDRHTGDVILRWFPHEAYVGRLAVSPDGRYVLSAGRGLLAESDVNTGESRLGWARHVAGVATGIFTPDGTEAVSASADATVRVWDVADGSNRLVLKEGDAAASSLAVSPDGTRVAVGYLDGFMREFDLADGGLIRYAEQHRGHVKSMIYTPDGAWLLSSADDGAIRIRHAEQRPGYSPSRVLHGFHRGGVLSLAVSEDSSLLLSAGRDATVGLWDLQSRAYVRGMEGHWGWVTSVAFTGADTAVSGGADGRVIYWNLETGEIIREMNHGGTVEAVVSSPDGAYAYSANSAGTIVCWRLETGEQVAILRGHTGQINGLAVAPDGSRLLSGSADTTLLVWDAPAHDKETGMDPDDDAGAGDMEEHKP